jgi:hypothetical protein
MLNIYQVCQAMQLELQRLSHTSNIPDGTSIPGFLFSAAVSNHLCKLSEATYGNISGEKT